MATDNGKLHQRSPRCRRPFTPVDGGSLPATLIASELFGHERGAFTGALSARAGVFETSRGGTVFLDEIGELPLDLQTRLLRVLDTGEFRRVGGSATQRADVRVIAATNRNLEEAVREGRFRQDLFYRVAVARVHMPPLRERREDVLTLARHFLHQAGCAHPDAILTPAVAQTLEAYHWPGNVRELRNVMARAAVLPQGIELALMQAGARRATASDGARPRAANLQVADMGALHCDLHTRPKDAQNSNVAVLHVQLDTGMSIDLFY